MSDKRIGRPRKNPFREFYFRMQNELTDPYTRKVWDCCLRYPKTQTQIVKEVKMDPKTVKRIIKKLSKPTTGFGGRVKIRLLLGIPDKEVEKMRKLWGIMPEKNAKYYYSIVASIVLSQFEYLGVRTDEEFKIKMYRVMGHRIFRETLHHFDLVDLLLIRPSPQIIKSIIKLEGRAHELEHLFTKREDSYYTNLVKDVLYDIKGIDKEIEKIKSQGFFKMEIQAYLKVLQFVFKFIESKLVF